LYLALEDNDRRLQNRALKLLEGQQLAYDFDLATEWPRFDEGGLLAIEEWLKDHPLAHLIVIDTLKRVRPHERANSRLYDTDYEALAPLGDLAREYNVCILVIHHTRKADSDDPIDLVSGSLGLTGAADGVLVLKRSRGQADATLHATGRDFEDQEIALRWDAELRGWDMLSEGPKYQRSEARQKVIDVLAASAEAMAPKAVAKVLSREYSAVKKLMWCMAKDGEIHADASGQYTVTGNSGNPGNPVTEEYEASGYPVTRVTPVTTNVIGEDALGDHRSF
nr:AAA family ATPase [Acidobacteriota bacterium]